MERLHPTLNLWDLRALWDAQDLPIVSADHRVRVYRTPPSSPLGDLYIKVYRNHRLRSRLTSLFRRSRAQREFETLEFLLQRKIEAVEPLAWSAARSFRIEEFSCLVTRAFPDSVTVERFLSEGRHLGPARSPFRRAALRRLAGIVASLHRLLLSAADLHFRNILIQPASFESKEPEFRIIDQPRAHRLDRARASRRLHAFVFDLATLDKHASQFLSRTDRWRFWLAYQHSAPSDLKHQAPRIPHLVRQRVAHLQEKRARKLAQSASP